MPVTNQTNYEFYPFPLSEFCIRYLCGGDSMRQLRHVSRTELLLARLGLDYPEGALLDMRINRFSHAVELFSNLALSKSTLLEAHSTLTGTDTRGFRKNESWIGPDKASSKYPEVASVKEIDQALSYLVDDHNSSSHLQPLQHVYSFMELLSIHPFQDANGRVARAFHIAQERKMGIQVPATLYRYKHGENELYIGEAHNFKASPKTYLTNTEFWQRAYDWSDFATEKILELIKNAKNILDTQTLLTPLNSVDISIIKHLWQQPITTQAYISQTLDLPIYDVGKSINTLVSYNILQPSRIKKRTLQPVYHNVALVNLYKNVEKLLFK
ncbi:Fic family protein [Pseudoalteromonas luteoviolacea]|uniref:Fido domain-containing protein n=1 Tax=Pseudoalteromonas luteoviolacea (strain 2ta16) TaxID=1353533 RepID=V4H451_PSEL2|nr:Fic family protein [Pseudoalteromonas luteoviolacea]ESP92271.1 hypothetical protein PL2TA16_05108 [Pseudoalteromonas luteoviolacea 2ta16]KZN29380.1 hypothetical protein N483_08050 [Pseudoalteromonas luteoviolacea NCIMB 1944]